MAARRLLIIMVVLLAISTLAAALVPSQEDRDGKSSTASSTTGDTTTEPAEGAPETAGKGPGTELVSAEVIVGKDKDEPERIPVSPGDQLTLLVSSPEPGEVSLPDFGLLQFAGPGSPARFDVLIEEAGEYDVRFQSQGAIATILAKRSRQ